MYKRQVRGGKAIMKLIGIDCGSCRLPIKPFSVDEMCIRDRQVVITERIARKYFKDEDPIGKILIFTGTYDKVSRCV